LTNAAAQNASRQASDMARRSAQAAASAAAQAQRTIKSNADFQRRLAENSARALRDQLQRDQVRRTTEAIRRTQMIARPAHGGGINRGGFDPHREAIRRSMAPKPPRPTWVPPRTIIRDLDRNMMGGIRPGPIRGTEIRRIPGHYKYGR
jgi:hypothetical protein